jgi:hypothetical protein
MQKSSVNQLWEDFWLELLYLFIYLIYLFMGGILDNHLKIRVFDTCIRSVEIAQ